MAGGGSKGGRGDAIALTGLHEELRLVIGHWRPEHGRAPHTEAFPTTGSAVAINRRRAPVAHADADLTPSSRSALLASSDRRFLSLQLVRWSRPDCCAAVIPPQQITPSQLNSLAA